MCLSVLFVLFFPPHRKPLGKDVTEKEAAPSARVKREADSDGGEEVVFTKKPRQETVSANDLKWDELQINIIIRPVHAA